MHALMESVKKEGGNIVTKAFLLESELRSVKGIVQITKDSREG